MNRKAILLLAASLIGGYFAGHEVPGNPVSASRVSSGETGNPPAEAASAMNELSKKLDALSHDVLSLKAEVSRLSAESRRSSKPNIESAVSTNGSGLAEEANDDAESEAEFERQRQEIVAAREAGFYQEAPDPAWSAAAQTAVRGALAKHNVALDAATVLECRSSACRLEMSGDAAKALNEQFTWLMIDLAEVISGSNMEQIPVDSEGNTKTVVYLRRAGTQG